MRLRPQVLVPAFLVVVAVGAASQARADDKETQQLADSRYGAESALFQVVAQRVGLQPPETAGEIDPQFGKITCSRTGRRAFRCRFRYMPGNTIYRGRGTLRLALVDTNILKAAYDLRGESERLPPAKRFRWRGRQVVYFGQGP